MKRPIGIQQRMLLAGLLPVTLVALLLAVVFLLGRVGDNSQAQRQREQSLIRQVAAVSEYGVFSANVGALQAVANGVMREADVHAVVIRSAAGQVLASAGRDVRQTAASPVLGARAGADQRADLDRLVEPIRATQLALDDMTAGAGSVAAAPAPALGSVEIEFSRAALLARERELLLAGVGVALVGLLFGGLLALVLGQGVVRPIMRVSQRVERIGQGDLSADAQLLQGDPLQGLQQALNTMAMRLERGRDELERQVAAATAELVERKDEAEAATRAKSQFLAAASHDLRQPTHALGMFVSRLAQLPHDADTAHLVANLEASVRAMQDLLDSLLDISRLDAGAVLVSVQPVALQSVFQQVGAALQMQAKERGLRLRIRSSVLWGMSDPALLQRILLNLVANALRYTARGSVLLAARTSRDGQRVRIEVRDSGIGIASEHHARIFQEFFQVHNAERDRSKGLGLGLNIVQRTAQLLGHPVGVRSALGCGSCFFVELPSTMPVPGATAVSGQEAPVLGGLDGLEVLVIEDDRLAAVAVGGLLQAWGCKVRVADGLEQAVRCLEQGLPVQVIVSDYRLRDEDNGILAIAHLRRRFGPHIAACLMSGDMDPGLLQVARDAGLTLLHKPVRPAKLRSLLRSLADAT